MNEITRLALPPALIVLGWFASVHRPETARRAVRVAGVCAFVAFASIVATGLFRSVDNAALIHRWSAQLYVIFLWLVVPFAIGVALRQRLPRRPLAAIGTTAALLALLGVVLLASITGYLDPSGDPDGTAEPRVVAESQNRFIVLHYWALPIAAGTLLAIWWWSFRPSTDCRDDETP